MSTFFAYSEQRVDTKPHNAKPNAKITLFALEKLIKGPQPECFTEIRALYREGYESADKSKLEAAKSEKKYLPWFLGSGFCPVHHNNETLEYNGFIQGDLDFKFAGGDVCAHMLIKVVRELMELGALPYVAFVCLSPSGYGVKFLLRTDCTDIAQHGAAAAAVIADLSAALGEHIPEGVKFDDLGASQPWFIPYDQGAFFNHNTTPFHFVAPERAPNTDNEHKPAAAPQRYHSGTTANKNDLQSAYNYLFENRVVLATCYDEYLPVLGACISAFGDDGTGAAWDLLENSPAFLLSDFRKHFDSHAKSFKTVITPAEWLFKQARAHGWRGGHAAGNDAQKTILDGAAGERFTDIHTRHGIELPGKRWIVPTGTGKTFAVNDFARAGNKTVLAVPTKALARNVAAEYGAIFWDGKNRTIVQDAGFYVSTYASLPAFASRVESVKEWHLFVDEAHNFTAAAAAGYMYKPLCRVLDIAPHFATLTTLTGTDVETYHPVLLALPKIEIKKPCAIPKTVQTIRTANTLDAAAHGVARAVFLGKKCIVALNDKGVKLAKLKARLQLVEGAKVEYFNSENKDGEAFAELCRNAMFPEGVNVIVTTSVLKEGNNINDQGDFAFIFLGRFHAVEVEQLTARARKADTIEAVIIKGIQDAEKSANAENFNPAKVKYMVEKEALKRVEILNKWAKDANGDVFLETVLNKAVGALEQAENGRALPIVRNEREGGFCVDPLLLANYVFEAEKGAQYHSDQVQAAALKQYGFETMRGCVVEAPPMIAPEGERAAVEAYKAQQQKEYNETLERLTGRGVTPATIQNELEQCQTKGGRRAALEAVARVVGTGFVIPDAVAAVRKYAPTPSRKKAGELCDKITFYLVSENIKQYTGTRVGDFTQSMKAAFKDGEKVTTLDLIARVEQATGKTYSDEKRADKALRLARLLFDVRPTKERLEGGKTVHVWVLCSVSFDLLYKKKNQKINGTVEHPNAVFARLETI